MLELVPLLAAIFVTIVALIGVWTELECGELEGKLKASKRLHNLLSKQNRFLLSEIDRLKPKRGPKGRFMKK